MHCSPKIAEGKVRTLFEVDEKTLLFVATDRISAYDVIMDNVSNSNYPQSSSDAIDNIRVSHLKEHS